ncbi:MAG: 5-formyltetrahydrofolate cyclo-ligase [Thermodesulfovibrionales bacterium]|nr:5-formyltetrahydrofolate cyclo-ligase [Thermodesulfovibrionales bacterium]
MDSKDIIRKRILLLRDSIPIDEKTQKDKIIRENLLALMNRLTARNVLVYVSFRSEVDTRQMIEDLLRLDLNVLVPKVIVETGMIRSYLIKDLNELSKGFYGILEPLDAKIFTCKRYVKGMDVDVCITPGVVFDEQKNRLGYGKGYYDRFLKPIKTQKGDGFFIIGLAYEEQVLQAIPYTDNDVKMDMIITDKRVIV